MLKDAANRSRRHAPPVRGVLQHAGIVNATALARARLSALTLPRDSAQVAEVLKNLLSGVALLSLAAFVVAALFGSATSLIRWMNARQPDARRSRPVVQRLIVALSIVGLAWFSIEVLHGQLHDSETEAYVGTLIASATHGRSRVDATGHYAALAPYVLWPSRRCCNRSLAHTRFVAMSSPDCFSAQSCSRRHTSGTRRVGLGWFASLLGLVLLSTYSPSLDSFTVGAR